MVKKNYEDYIPLIKEKLIKRSPVHGHEVTDREIRAVLKYFHKNMLTSMKRGDHLFFDPYLWFVNKLHDGPR